MQSTNFPKILVQSMLGAAICSLFSMVPLVCALAFGIPSEITFLARIHSPVSDYLMGILLAIGLHFVIGFIFVNNKYGIYWNIIWTIKIWVTLFFAVFYEISFASLDAFEYFGVATFFLGWHYYFLQRFMFGTKNRISSFAVATVFLFLSGYVRMWIPVIFGISSIFSIAIVSKNNFNRNFGILSATLALIVSARYFSIGGIDDIVHYFDHASKLWAYGGSGQMAPTFSSLSDLIIFLPTGMFSALFRPLPGE
ncbi:MAG: hypothetical protein NTX25_23520, partial [Proteobacteria bacterium]|nr:hypothetical protein [Pseudomonadota bacterium]